MKHEMNDQELENVTGGTVVISADYRTVGFTTTREKFNLKEGKDPFDALSFVNSLKRNNPNMSDPDFDALAKKQLKAGGWI